MTPLIWVDLEMTGLNEEVDQVIELCMLLTDYDLIPIQPTQHFNPDDIPQQFRQSPDGCWYLHFAIHYDDELMEKLMPSTQNHEGAFTNWCRNTHTQTGLIQEIHTSDTSLQKANELVLKFLSLYDIKLGDGKMPILCGSSVHADKRFLKRYFPQFDSEILHYRIIDVSTIKELCRVWNASVYENLPKKLNKHKALDDILESLQELRYYKKHLFILSK